MKKSLVLVVIGILFFSGCAMTKKSKALASTPQLVVKKVSKEEIKKALNEEKKKYLFDDEYKTFTAVGEGIAPTNAISSAQALVLARKAALADAYKRLGEKLYGVRINSTETVKDAMLQNSRIVSKVNGLIKDASIISEEYKDGIYRIKLELKISKKVWNDIFSY